MIADDAALTQARLWLVEACRIGLAIALDLLGVHAPDEMARVDDDDERRGRRVSAPFDLRAARRDASSTPTAARDRRRRPRRARRASSARRCSSTTRTTCGPAAARPSPAFGDGASRTRPRRSSAWRWPASSHEEGMHLDVATGGELHVALPAGVPADRLVFHGNNKSDDELRAALDAGVGRIVVDSFDELDRLERARGRAARRARACSCGSRPASRRTPTSSSRPARTTRSSASAVRHGDARSTPSARVVDEPTRSSSSASTATSAPRCSRSTPSRARSTMVGLVADDRGATGDAGRGAQPRRRPRRAPTSPTRRRRRSRESGRRARRARQGASRDAGVDRGPRLTVEPGRAIVGARPASRCTRSARSRRSPASAPTSRSTAA